LLDQFGDLRVEGVRGVDLGLHTDAPVLGPERQARTGQYAWYAWEFLWALSP
jgi:hypothetical protein